MKRSKGVAPHDGGDQEKGSCEERGKPITGTRRRQVSVVSSPCRVCGSTTAIGEADLCDHCWWAAFREAGP